VTALQWIAVLVIGVLWPGVAVVTLWRERRRVFGRRAEEERPRRVRAKPVPRAYETESVSRLHVAARARPSSGPWPCARESQP
jgi:hypothetical protein